MWTLRFWRDALERAIKTFAQALLAFLGATAVGLTDIAWLDALNVAALAAVVSLLTSLVSGTVPTDTVATPSLVSVLPEPRRPLAGERREPPAPVT